MARNESKIYGHNACRALFEERPDDIKRVLVDEASAKRFGDLLKHCAKRHLPYRIVGHDELEAFSGARHHEGICVAAFPKEPRALEELLAAKGKGLILALDQVGNPHNVGTMIRTAAHFGAIAVICASKSRSLPPAGYRTAEGGAEKVELYFVDELDEGLDLCREAGYQVCASSSHRGESLYAKPLPTRCVLLLGSERDGLSKTAIDSADQLICIPGSGAVESLNVAASAAVILGEYWRVHS